MSTQSSSRLEPADYHDRRILNILRQGGEWMDLPTIARAVYPLFQMGVWLRLRRLTMSGYVVKRHRIVPARYVGAGQIAEYKVAEAATV